LDLAKSKVTETRNGCNSAGENLKLGKEDFEAHKAWFLKEIDRLKEDYKNVDAVIKIFK